MAGKGSYRVAVCVKNKTCWKVDFVPLIDPLGIKLVGRYLMCEG